MTPKEKKAGLQKLSDLCACVNAFEGYFMAYPVTPPNKKADKAYWRQRNALTDCVMNQAEYLARNDVPLHKLNKAIQNAGWEDNYFVCIDPIKPSLKILYK
jgi:hypothetical protein